MTMFQLTLVSALTLAGCVEDPESSDDTGTSATDGGADDTGADGIPFEVVLDNSSQSPSQCGLKGEPLPPCGGAGLAVLPASTKTELETLFAMHMPFPAPEVDLDGSVALLSYLSVCPSKSDRLVMDHIALDGATLQVDEIFLHHPAPNQVVGCLFNLVTIPDTDFTDISTTLTDSDDWEWE